MKKIIAISLSIFVCSHVDAAQFVFPQNGQSAEQQNQDEYYCHSWATKQTGYDPSAIAQAQNRFNKNEIGTIIVSVACNM